MKSNHIFSRSYIRHCEDFKDKLPSLILNNLTQLDILSLILMLHLNGCPQSELPLGSSNLLELPKQTYSCSLFWHELLLKLSTLKGLLRIFGLLFCIILCMYRQSRNLMFGGKLPGIDEQRCSKVFLSDGCMHRHLSEKDRPRYSNNSIHSGNKLQPFHIFLWGYTK